MKEGEGEIRVLGLEDYDALLALWERAGLGSIRPRGRDSREAVERQLASGVQTILGLVADGRLVGAAVASHDSRKGWVNRVAVDPGCRRRGYGTRLVEAAEEALRRQGIRIFAGLVAGDNTASLAMLRRMGYVEIDPGIRYLSKRDTDDV